MNDLETGYKLAESKWKEAMSNHGKVIGSTDFSIYVELAYEAYEKSNLKTKLPLLEANIRVLHNDTLHQGLVQFLEVISKKVDVC